MEDEDWAERVRKVMAAKLRQSKAAAIGESERQERANEVDEISGRVRAVAERSQFALETSAVMCVSVGPEWPHPRQRGAGCGSQLYQLHP